MCLDFRRIAFMTLMLSFPTSCRSSQLMSQSFGSVGLMIFGKEQKVHFFITISRKRVLYRLNSLALGGS